MPKQNHLSDLQQSKILIKVMRDHELVLRLQDKNLSMLMLLTKQEITEIVSLEVTKLKKKKIKSRNITIISLQKQLKKRN